MTRLKNWWLRQTRTNQIWLGTAAAAMVLGIWLQNASWFLGWQFYNVYGNTSYQTLDVSQTQKFCGTYGGVYPTSQTASDCGSANNWTTILDLLFWAGLVTLVVTLWRIHRSKSNKPEPPAQGRHVGATSTDQPTPDHPYPPTATYSSYNFPRHGRRKTGVVQP